MGYDYDDLDTYLTSDFSQELPSSLEEHFEPVYNQDMDFGALPPSDAGEIPGHPDLVGMLGPVEGPGLRVEQHDDTILVPHADATTETTGLEVDLLDARDISPTDASEITAAPAEQNTTTEKPQLSVRFADVIDLESDEEPETITAHAAENVTTDDVSVPAAEVEPVTIEGGRTAVWRFYVYYLAV